MEVMGNGGESGGYGGEFEGREEEGDAYGEENEPEHSALLRGGWSGYGVVYRLHGTAKGTVARCAILRETYSNPVGMDWEYGSWSKGCLGAVHLARQNSADVVLKQTATNRG